MKELLNPRERFSLLVIDEPQDRVPIFPLLTARAAKFCGVSLRDYYTDGLMMAQCQLRAREFYNTDFISIFSEVGLIAEAIGSEFVYPEDDLPVLARPRWNTVEDAARGLKSEMALAGRVKVYLDAISYVWEAIADVVPVLAYVPAPFTTAQQLIEPEEFLVALLEKPELVKVVLDRVTQLVKAFSRLLIRAGALPILVDPLASGSVLSPREYQEFALPAEKAVIDFWHRYDLDVVLHICGDTSAIVMMMPETGADLISVDKVDLGSVIATVGEKVRVIGNFDTTELWLGTPKEIGDKVREMVAQAKGCPRGYVAATGCEVPIATPEENLRAFVSAAQEAGRYQFPPERIVERR
ncbi:hypothetical protein HPY86_05175 [candidate division WOR-3 bacterium]|nr:hypothetical protein [candidate division WOR-3 bacterium]